MSKRLRTLAAGLVVVALATTGCTSDEDVTGTPVPATTNASAPATEAVPTTETTAPTSEPATTTPAATTPATTATSATSASTQTTGLTGHPPDPTDGPRTKGFGGVTTYADKSAIRIDPPQPFTPTGGAAGQYVVLTITVVNNSPASAPIDFWWISATVDGQPVESLTDSSQGVGMPTGDLAPGQERSFKLAWPKRDGQELVVEVVWRDGYPFTYRA